jgi:hypothetical protein
MHNPLEQANAQPQASIQRLRSLPTGTLPPYDWQEFQRRSQQRLQPAHDAMDWRPIAAAAALLLFVCAIAIWGRFGGGGRHVVADSGAIEDVAPTRERGPVPLASYAQRPSASKSGGSEERAGQAATDDVAPESAIAANRSRAIESWLATLPREPVVVRVGTRAAVAGLEDRIAQVDDLMTSIRIDEVSPDRVAALQRERLRLVGSLAQVRYAEVVDSQSP